MNVITPVPSRFPLRRYLRRLPQFQRFRAVAAVVAAAVMINVGLGPGAGRAATDTEIQAYCESLARAISTPPNTATATSATTGWGYIFVDNCDTTAGLNYTNSATRLMQGNSANFANLVDHYATGSYRVVFRGLGEPGGMMHVSTYGGGAPDQCLVGYWYVTGYDETAVIHCYDINGALKDRRFMASFTSVRTNPDYEFGYLWADQPSAASYTPAAAYQFTTGATPNVITRTGTGRYQVTMTGITGSFENVMVSAYGGTSSGPARCRVVDSGGQIAHVGCFVNGTPVDSMFTLTYANQGNMLGAYNRILYPSWGHLSSAYAWVVGNGGSEPLTAWRFSTTGPYAWNQTYDPSSGLTTLLLPTAGNGGDVQVVPYGTGTAACDAAWVSDYNVVGTYENAVMVKCWDDAGHVTPGEFNLFFSGQPWD